MSDNVKSEVKKRQLGVEMCLSCNVYAKMLPEEAGFEKYYFGEWWKEARDGRPEVVLPTDDVGVLCSPLSQEYYLAARHFELNKRDLTKIGKDAVEIIFAGEEEKQRLRDMYN
ncbi:MAG: hypothetical protein M1820_003213 [Bogoriella megaspora]|nr:MAG: hypothetical protein M1820_003213 [Bogoriella megaspora]